MFEIIKCSVTIDQKDTVNKMLRDLNLETDSFIDNIPTMFLQKTIESESFKMSQNEKQHHLPTVVI
jgi:hypothetical protein